MSDEPMKIDVGAIGVLLPYKPVALGSALRALLDSALLASDPGYLREMSTKADIKELERLRDEISDFLADHAHGVVRP